MIDEVVGDAIWQAGQLAGADGIEDTQRGLGRGIAHGRYVAATNLLATQGYAGLSVAAVAAAAQVSPQTIYNSIGGKGALLKACYDVTLAGDEAEVPMSHRPEFVAMGQAASAGHYLESYAVWVRTLSERTAGILGPLVRPGAGGDAGAAEFLTAIESERRTGSTHAMARLRHVFGLPEPLTLERAVDICWTLNSPEVYDRLVARCDWSPDDYQVWLANQLRSSLLPDD